jgi:hypothetical protein
MCGPRRYVAIIMIVYGCQQGWGQSWSGIATYWYLLSPPPGGLGWNNTTFSLVLMLANIPWQIKALYGMVRIFALSLTPSATVSIFQKFSPVLR